MKTLRLLLLCGAIACAFIGCKSTEPENVSERPWNTQRGWEHGLPTGINQGR